MEAEVGMLKFKNKDWEELFQFVKGKKVVGITVPDEEGMDGFDINFSDGSSLEFYVIDGKLSFVLQEDQQ